MLGVFLFISITVENYKDFTFYSVVGFINIFFTIHINCYTGKHKVLTCVMIKNGKQSFNLLMYNLKHNITIIISW